MTLGPILFGLVLLLIGGLCFASLRSAFTADDRQFPTRDGDGHVR